MPIYDFSCSDCGRRFEALVASFRVKPPCPSCGGRRSKRELSLPAIHGSSRDAPMLPTCGAPAGGCGLVERPDCDAPDCASDCGGPQ
jgi:putative FmdB family regulatory protein